MNILILGSGGREHALALKISQSRLCNELHVLPGNSGMSDIARIYPDINIDDHDAIIQLVCDQGINFTIVGPEQPLVDGIVDRFQSEGLRIFGPVKAAARLEGSKAFAKMFMNRHGIPTARHATFTRYEDALEYVKSQEQLPVIKASGLAAGKGVLLPDSREDAETALRQIMLAQQFGAAGAEVVIEERLYGPELSVFALVRNNRYWILPPSRDHKRVNDHDEGLNTGGMGALSPVPGSDELLQIIDQTIVAPTVAGIAADGAPYEGFLYFGLMLTDSGPQVIEYNCRLGDPEAQVVLDVLAEDLLEALVMPEDDFVKRIIKADHYAVGVVLASGGYPEAYRKEIPISGLNHVPGDRVIHSGTKVLGDSIVTSGGRVLTVIGRGANLTEARIMAYQYLEKIRFADMHYRNDIGLTTLQQQRKR